MFKITKKGIVINDTVRVNYGAFAVLALETAVVVRDCKKNGPVGIVTGLSKCLAGEAVINVSTNLILSFLVLHSYFFINSFIFLL